MKKTLVLILAGLIALSAAACNNNDDNNSKSENNNSAIISVESKEESKADESSAEESKEEESSEVVAAEKVSDPYEVLTKTWNNFADDEKFAAVGGDWTEENLTDGAPGKYTLDDASNVEYALSLPSAQFDNVDSAASLMHMMNANTFTCAAFHVKEGVEVEEFTKAVRDFIQAKHWMCGMPEKVAVYVVGECVVYCYGHNPLMDYFKNHLTEAYPDVSVAYYEDIDF